MLVLRTSLLAALVAGVLAAGGCSSSPRCPPGASCPATVPKVTFTPTIDGVSFALRKDGHVPRYQARPGQTLVMRVAVTVPKQVTITALWFGISTGTWGGGPNGPIGMNPILAHYRQVLPTGSHTFDLHWRIPHRHSHSNWYLTYAWSSNQPPASVSGPIATLALPSTSTGS
jgi:hypothetical protein